MSEINIGELKSNLLTELDASDTEKIVGGTYFGHNYFHGYYGGKISFNFKKFDLQSLLDKIYAGGFKKGETYSYSYGYINNNGKVHKYSHSHKW